jgi:transcriptional regulator with XRE-family HTH domain
MGKDTARAYSYCLGMPARSITPEDQLPVFAANLSRLLERAGLNQTQLAEKSGVSQRHISALVRGESDCTLQVAEQLAKPFGLRGWQLMLPNLPIELVNSPRVLRLVETYLDASEEGRALLDAMAQRERRLPTKA